MKIALVYDRINKWGGAERVLQALHEIFPKAPLLTAVYHKKKATWANIFDISPSFLQKFPLASSHHELYAPLMPLSFESFIFDQFDVVISVTSEAGKGIITKPHTMHICYCLTPTRYLWSGHEEYFRHSLTRRLASPVINYLRKWDSQAAFRPDKIIAISKEVQARITKYYGLESEIIYPPVILDSTTTKKDTQHVFIKEPFFLVVSRLVPYKRIDLAIRACNRLKLPLVIIGTGIEEIFLKRIAGPTIIFLGNLTDDELVRYYNDCEGLIFPGKEDFGLVIIEAQRFGKPVLAYRAGGALETIIEGKTGLFFDEQSIASITEKLKEFSITQFDRKACINQANRFTIESFKKNFLRLINTIKL